MTPYCDSIFQTNRRKTRVVQIGSVAVGGGNPVRIQSMTTTDTRDAKATVDQIMRLSDVGCEIVRVTVQGKKEAESCEIIKNNLLSKGYSIPLVADIHFYPPAALLVADFVDKVRINPGNFVDRRATFKTIEYDEKSYAQEVQKIEEGFSPLVEKCKRRKISMRIGTNHGSLSDRILNRFGNTPKGMVESAFEFARVCRMLDYHEFLFSMKSSNPMVMVQAYRLLCAEMMELGWDYPLHLGVTEAGEGEDGRIKSAMGIGALLMDGIGDTIRVSLTEDPIQEIDPCRQLASLASRREGIGVEAFSEQYRNWMELSPRTIDPPSFFQNSVILRYDPLDLNQIQDLSGIDALWVKEPLPAALSHRMDEMGIRVFSKNAVCHLQGGLFPREAEIPEALFYQPLCSPIHETRRLIDDLKVRGLSFPVILCLDLAEEGLIQVAVDAGSLFCDRLVEGICLLGAASIEERKRISFNLLQSARMRMTKTDYISCPSCGRTLFNLQEVSKRIRERTSHLAGVKIAIMGCIVNGPGEMADADFGYVGSKPGKVDLYVGKTRVEKEIDFSEADQKLIDLIARHGKWVDPPIL